MWLGQQGVGANQTLLQGIYPSLKYAARIKLCSFKQYLSVKLWSYCCVCLDEAERPDFNMQYTWQLDQTLTIEVFFFF